MRLPWRRRRNLAERLRPYIRPLPTPEPMVSADPIRMFLYRWMIETGDPVEVIARGFDLDPCSVVLLLDGRIRMVSVAERLELQSKLGLVDDLATSDRQGLRQRIP